MRKHVYVLQFSVVHQLWGHEDWIRDLSVTIDGNVSRHPCFRYILHLLSRTEWVADRFSVSLGAECVDSTDWCLQSLVQES